MNTTSLPLRAGALTLLFALAAACGNSGNPQPTGSGGTGGSTVVGGGGTGGTGTTTTTATNTGGSAGAGGTGTGGTGTGGSGGCFMGTPANNDQFLNACNNLTCQSFDNKAKLPKLNADGSLPALP